MSKKSKTSLFKYSLTDGWLRSEAKKKITSNDKRLNNDTLTGKIFLVLISLYQNCICNLTY